MRMRLIGGLILGMAIACVAGCLVVEVERHPCENWTPERVCDRPIRPEEMQGSLPAGVTECVAMPKRSDREWCDDFESCPSGRGSWPALWIGNGNAENHTECYVDGSTFTDSHGNTLRLHGSSSSWSPLAYTSMELGTPFRLSFDVFMGSQSLNGACVVGLRERPSWTAPGVFVFDVTSSGEVRSFETVSDGGEVNEGVVAGELHTTPGKWYHVVLELREQDGRQHLTITVDDGKTTQGPAHVSSDTILVRDMPCLQLEMREGTAWFDNVSVASLGQ